MRFNFLLLILLLLLSGCVGKSNCSTVSQTVDVTEVDFERIPRNVTQYFVGFEPYVVKRLEDVPLEYQAFHGARITKENVVYESGTLIEYGRVNQNLNGTITITLTNNDSVGGFFRINVTLLKESENSTKSKIDYLKPNETKDFEFNFGLNRGDELLYRYLVIPPTRKVEVSNVAYRDVNETRIVTIFDTVRHEVVKPVVREVQVC